MNTMLFADRPQEDRSKAFNLLTPLLEPLMCVGPMLTRDQSFLAMSPLSRDRVI